MAKERRKSEEGSGTEKMGSWKGVMPEKLPLAAPETVLKELSSGEAGFWLRK